MHHLVQASHPPVNCQKITTINDVLCGLGGSRGGVGCLGVILHFFPLCFSDGYHYFFPNKHKSIMKTMMLAKNTDSIHILYIYKV